MTSSPPKSILSSTVPLTTLVICLLLFGEPGCNLISPLRAMDKPRNGICQGCSSVLEFYGGGSVRCYNCPTINFFPFVAQKGQRTSKADSNRTSKKNRNSPKSSSGEFDSPTKLQTSTDGESRKRLVRNNSSGGLRTSSSGLKTSSKVHFRNLKRKLHNIFVF